MLRCGILLSFVEFCSAVSEEKSKCLSQSEAGAAILVVRSARNNTNLVEDVEILFPIKFRCSSEEKSKMRKVSALDCTLCCEGGNSDLPDCIFNGLNRCFLRLFSANCAFVFSNFMCQVIFLP